MTVRTGPWNKTAKTWSQIFNPPTWTLKSLSSKNELPIGKADIQSPPGNCGKWKKNVLIFMYSEFPIWTASRCNFKNCFDYTFFHRPSPSVFLNTPFPKEFLPGADPAVKQVMMNSSSAGPAARGRDLLARAADETAWQETRETALIWKANARLKTSPRCSVLSNLKSYISIY